MELRTCCYLSFCYDCICPGAAAGIALVAAGAAGIASGKEIKHLHGKALVVLVTSTHVELHKRNQMISENFYARGDGTNCRHGYIQLTHSESLSEHNYVSAMDTSRFQPVCLRCSSMSCGVLMDQDMRERERKTGNGVV
ncbi:uncharacterized protein LOC130761253 isoform X2 [Actinidia eriantha]|uniref:uncharacterized protein LOC130761253 isoform X2 n=1 Tax=Actinidia eriantha TaxID=165200 RepID=UPI002584A7B2|nr:uncharacterized protein LOC130761253 isoform X2 [Actinidia eriantha]